MAIGDILTFGTLRWYYSEGTYYDVKQLTSHFRSYPSYKTFTFVDTNDTSYMWKWVEASVNGRKMLISKTIAFDFRTKVPNDILKNVTLNGTTYAIRMLTVEEFRSLSTNVLNQIDFNLDNEIDGDYSTFYCATSTILANGKRVFIGKTKAGNLEEISKSVDEIDNPESSYFYKANVGFLPILEEIKTPPIISGNDSDLGRKSTGFSVSYSVTAADASDEVIITEKLNGNLIRTLKNPSQGYALNVDITDQLFSSLNMNSINTIEISASNNTATSYRRYTFMKTNSGPIINYTGQSDLGQLTTKPTISYSVHDNEGDVVTVTEKLNGNIIRTFNATLGTNYSITLTNDFWITCNGSLNTVEIIATDSEGTTSTKSITFSRKVNKIQFTTKNPIETSTAASKIILTPQWNITNAVGTVEVCNNYFDSSPTWENMTSVAGTNRPYTFSNSTKTASKWGIGIRITITKNANATNEVAIYGFGGAYE